MRGLFNIYTRIMDGVARLAIVFCGSCLALLITVTGWMVYGRYVLNDPPTWAENSALILILFVSACGSAVGIREKLHLRIVLVLEHVSPGKRRGLEIVVNVLLLAFAVVMAHGGYSAAEQVWRFPDAMLPISRGTYYIPMFVTGVLMALFEVEILGQLFFNIEEDAGNGAEAA